MLPEIPEKAQWIHYCLPKEEHFLMFEQIEKLIEKLAAHEDTISIYTGTYL